ncbi:bifunctional heptose 7-phosphate kinase/heptose 1-phosphate adenyltransferase, partial [bacterium]|nr:bifunctional heptose 7-phosphate kinase/heptose 1-phosphate adenyltransferase [bacterium]
MIGIIGDVMLDIYTYGRVTKLAQEARVPVLEKKEDNFYLGGAGNTAKNLVSLNKKVFLFGLVGNDKEGVKIRKLCKENNINFFFVSDGRPTTSKHRYLDHHKNKIHIRIDT